MESRVLGLKFGLGPFMQDTLSAGSRSSRNYLLHVSRLLFSFVPLTVT